LRAFAVRVGCHSGSSYPGQPLWVERENARAEVVEVDASWREEERLGFRVRLADGEHMLLYYIPELELWSGVTQSAAPRRAIVAPKDAPP